MLLLDLLFLSNPVINCSPATIPYSASAFHSLNSIIRHPASVICYLTSFLLSSFRIPNSTFQIHFCPLSSILCHPSSVVYNLSSVLHPPSSLFHHLPSVLCPPSSVIPLPSSLYHHLPSALCCLSSALCPLFSVLCHLFNPALISPDSCGAPNRDGQRDVAAFRSQRPLFRPPYIFCDPCPHHADD